MRDKKRIDHMEKMVGLQLRALEEQNKTIASLLSLSDLQDRRITHLKARIMELEIVTVL